MKKSSDGVKNRISKIEGQLNGIRKMLDNDKACMDVMAQILAIREAVSALGIEILKDDLICNKKNLKGLDEQYLKTLFKIK
ncbi:MAG: metal-sensitive transcriptional regulator [Patescibacteria group bacterium]|jgi:DNA-binding FrmR family transcriptional regulator|nr:metal-sensitive transcriptional regulator [Patescibacteria group bacterium]